MRGFTLEHIVLACQGEFFGDPGILSKEIHSISIDSRNIEENSVFIPILGQRVDGHTFIPEVMQKGALATLSEKKRTDDIPYILVKSSLQALKDIAEFYREFCDIPVVGITGSVGKTSTKEMIASVLSQKYCVLKTDGNFNNEIGLPLTLFRLRNEHEIAVLEMGISDFGEMHRLSKIAKPNIVVITNIGMCHLENLKTRDGILQAKSEIFDYLQEDGHIILNGDDDKLSTIQKKKGSYPLFFSMQDLKPASDDTKAKIYASDIQNLGLDGTECKITVFRETFSVKIPTPGIYMVGNALAACAVGHVMGLTIEEMKIGIEALQPVSGRFHKRKTERFLVIDDCYNANPVSMKASIDILSYAKERKVCILGDMLELGENERKLHYEIGAHMVETAIDILITIGDLGEEIYKGAQNFKGEKYHFTNKQEAMQKFDEILKDGDAILVKASHGMNFSKIVEYLTS